MTIWRVNRMATGVVLLVALLLFCVLVVRFVLSLVGAVEDMHGYTRIFSVLLGVVLLLPLTLLVLAAQGLRQFRPAGLVYQLLAGVVVGFYGASMPVPARWIGVGLGGGLAVLALIGLLATRRSAP